LDRLFEGRELDREWHDADRRVVPQDTGKRVVDADAGSADELTGTGEGTGTDTDTSADGDAASDP
jgi:tRNA (cytidine56-2'-O)-methyltransferase